MPDHSRIWIYQGGRPLSSTESAEAFRQLKNFCEGWEAHGATLRTSCFVANSQFLILAVDEGTNGASGCSIDGSVQVIRSLSSQFQTDFLDRSRVPFLKNGTVEMIAARELKNAFRSGILAADTPTFLLTATTVGEWRKGWIIPAGESWLSSVLAKAAVGG